MKKEFSASRINTYKTCPKLFYYNYVEKLEEPRHVLTIMGSALHKSIENFYKKNIPPLVTFNKEFYNGVSFAENEVGLKGRDTPVQVALLGQSIIDSIQWDFKPTELEKSFMLPFPNKENPVCIMRGIIDMILEDGIIIDHKSSKTKPTKKKLADNYQFTIYAWAYRELYGKLPEVVYWHHLRTAELITADVLTDFEEKLTNIVNDVILIINDKEFNKVEKNSFCQNVCNFYEKCWGENV
jgi:CRISPR/Cas system-associated exonuclease Cas4 (RecB family)